MTQSRVVTNRPTGGKPMRWEMEGSGGLGASGWGARGYRNSEGQQRQLRGSGKGRSALRPTEGQASPPCLVPLP